MKPEYNELLSGSTRWVFRRKGVSYLVNFHGYSEPTDDFEGHPGTWAYYLMIPEQMFSHRWADFACVRNDDGFTHHGTAFDSVKFDSEITWASSEPNYSHKEGREFDVVKVGCDYCHLWHREQGYPHTFEWVKGDAEATVDSFLEAHPDRKMRCDYSHIWGDPLDFYASRNGRMVHKTQREILAKQGWEAWLPDDMEMQS